MASLVTATNVLLCPGDQPEAKRRMAAVARLLTSRGGMSAQLAGTAVDALGVTSFDVVVSAGAVPDAAAMAALPRAWVVVGAIDRDSGEAGSVDRFRQALVDGGDAGGGVVRLAADSTSETIARAIIALARATAPPMADDVVQGPVNIEVDPHVAEALDTDEGLHLLLLEDDPLMMELVQTYVEASGIPVEQLDKATTLGAALALIDDRVPDAIVADLGLPDSRGLDTVRRLREHAPSTALVVLSGNGDENTALQAVLLGADDYLLKGEVDERQLWRALRYSTQRKRFEDRVSYLSQFDRLTGLLNRYSFAGRLSEALQRGSLIGHNTGVFLIDLDRFKAVRKWLGQTAADALLSEVAGRLRGAVPEHTIVAREGEDEFAVLVEDVGPTQERARSLARRILVALRTPFTVDGGALTCTASIGVAIHPQAGHSAEALMRAADAAVMVAKSRGRNTLHIATEADPGAPLSRLRLEHALRRALEQRQFKVHLQPIYDLRNARIASCEALLRWNPEDGSSIGTERVVRALEDMGLIAQAGKLVLATALQMLAELRQQPGLEALKVAVNLSPLQFTQTALVDVVSNALEDAGLSPTCLELEITESLLLDETPEVQGTLLQLRHRGIRVAIDDFGTGYASFAYLSRFRCDTIKIDRSFVEKLGTADGNASVRAILGLARELGLSVVAEGVERPDQLEFLVAEGCDYAQGYLLARPSAAIDAEMAVAGPIERLLTAHHATTVTPEATPASGAEVLAALPDVVAEFDRDGVFVATYGRTRWFGFAPEEVVGRRLIDVFSPHHARMALAAIRRASETQLMQVAQFSRDIQGGVKHYEARVSPTAAGTVLMVSREVSERVNARAMALERSGELLSVAREVETFAFLATRDLQSPVDALRVGVQHLVSVGGADSVEVGETLMQRLASIERSLAGLRQLSRSGGGATMGPVDLQGVLSEVLHTLTERIEAMSAIVIAEGLPVVHGDAAQLRQALAALLDNALCHATSEALSVTVAATIVGDMWAVTVADNGGGVEAEAAEQIFEPFVTFNGDGPGIGLSMCRRVVRHHGGRIWVERGADGGTVVHFTLPSVRAS